MRLLAVVVCFLAFAGSASAGVVDTALRLAGPKTATVECDPSVDAYAAGETYWRLDPPRIVLGTVACAAVLLADATPAQRKSISRLNPERDLDQMEGWGLMVLLHEAAHVQGVLDETEANCAALSHMPALLASLNVPADLTEYMLTAAHIYFNKSPLEYRKHSC